MAKFPWAFKIPHLHQTPIFLLQVTQLQRWQGYYWDLCQWIWFWHFLQKPKLTHVLLAIFDYYRESLPGQALPWVAVFPGGACVWGGNIAVLSRDESRKSLEHASLLNMVSKTLISTLSIAEEHASVEIACILKQSSEWTDSSEWCMCALYCSG